MTDKTKCPLDVIEDCELIKQMDEMRDERNGARGEVLDLQCRVETLERELASVQDECSVKLARVKAWFHDHDIEWYHLFEHKASDFYAKLDKVLDSDVEVVRVTLSDPGMDCCHRVLLDKNDRDVLLLDYTDNDTLLLVKGSK